MQERRAVQNYSQFSVFYCRLVFFIEAIFCGLSTVLSSYFYTFFVFLVFGLFVRIYYLVIIVRRIFCVFSSCVFSSPHAPCPRRCRTAGDGQVATRADWNRDVDHKRATWAMWSMSDEISFLTSGSCSSARPLSSCGDRPCSTAWSSSDSYKRGVIGRGDPRLIRVARPNPTDHSQNHRRSWCMYCTIVACHLQSRACLCDWKENN